ncbi:hypothetical protein MUP79_01165 [Candidatus Bathyarchaeota archaeon]|nr:hypothetical protein [Candidatus Bathyarchaeota archaeon]
MNMTRILTRSWYCLGMGYSTYLNSLLGAIDGGRWASSDPTNSETKVEEA